MDFTRILPFDILCMIFSNPCLAENDCYTFRTVNKAWRKRVPEWAQNLWKTVYFNGEEELLLDRMIPFFGPHVDSIIFNILPEDKNMDYDDDEANICLDLLQLLLDHNCNRVISIGKETGPFFFSLSLSFLLLFQCLIGFIVNNNISIVIVVH